MKELSEETKKEIFVKLAKKGERPFKLADEYGISLPALMDIAVAGIKAERDAKVGNTSIPETSLNDADDTVESTKPVPTAKRGTRKADEKPTTIKWSDKLGMGGDFVECTTITYTEPAKPKTTKEKLDGTIDNAIKEFAKEAPEKAAELEQPLSPTCYSSKLMEKTAPISVDKLGALAYRLSKLHMSEDTIVKVLNIVLGVPEPAIREALV